MEAIATQLGVNQATVSRDLGDLCIMHKSKPAKTATNPKGAGRPTVCSLAPRRGIDEAQRLGDDLGFVGQEKAPAL
jgi:predicted ArsR family transcriptional regulator